MKNLLKRLAGRETPASQPAPPPRASVGWSGIPGEESLQSLTRDELLAWENRDVPTIGRGSDKAEAVADERQDLVTSLNFPLHWTTAKESWDYLFDFSVACDLLAPRPDDRVLDVAAGTGWATELLVRLGVRTVSIDLSHEMMRRGRQRLAADTRLVHRDDAAFVTARTQALPFANEAFDGVLCLNALHHLPDYGAALREIHRVLKPGGRAVFSEPGTAHGAAPHSQFRMREETVLEKAVSLPLIRRLALEAGFTRMRVSPLRSSSTYVFDYEAGDRDAVALDEMWSDTLKHSRREHARFVLHKGDDPPADTLLPPHHLEGRLRAEIVPLAVTATVGAGQPFTDRVRITNAGSVTWKARGRRFGGQVTCGLKVCTPAGDVLREDLGRTPLAADVAPGDTIEVTLTVAGIPEPGRYELRYDMVVEGVTWFEFQGSPTPRRTLEVR